MGGGADAGAKRPTAARIAPFARLVTTRPSIAFGLIAAGCVARLVSLALSWGKPLDIDSTEYLLLARRYSFAHPWSAGYREPLWRGIVKLAVAPFGYSPNAFRCFTTVVSIAALPVAWLVFRRLVRRFELRPRVGLIALAVVALSVQLIRSAPRGIREDLCLLIFLGAALPLLSGDRSRRAGIALGSLIAVFAVIRFELATLLLGVAVLFAIFRRVSPLAPAVAVVGLVLLAGPWLLANKDRHGTLFWNSEIHSTFYWKLEQPQDVVARYKTPLGVDPKVALSWQDYYLHFLGPAESAKRVVTGYPRLAAKLVASQAVPRGAAFGALGSNQSGNGWLAVLLAIGIAAIGGLVVAARRIWRAREAVPLFAGGLALLVLCIAPYAALASFVELRVILFTVPVLGLLVGCAVDACLPVRARAPRRVSAPAPIAEGSSA